MGGDGAGSAGTSGRATPSGLEIVEGKIRSVRRGPKYIPVVSEVTPAPGMRKDADERFGPEYLCRGVLPAGCIGVGKTEENPCLETHFPLMLEWQKKRLGLS